MLAIVFSDPFWLRRRTSGTVFPDPDPNFRVDPVFSPKSLKTELASAPLCKIALVTTHITKIHGLHLWKDDKNLNKTYVDHQGISCTH